MSKLQSRAQRGHLECGKAIADLPTPVDEQADGERSDKEPSLPSPMAQPTPVERMAVEYSKGASAIKPELATPRKKPANPRQTMTNALD